MAIKFTKSQQQVIDHKDGNLLVFASAGSGKTAVIIEKIAQSIINNQTSLDKLLVVTFTESATAEMKQRLYEKLSENIDKPNIKQELEKLPLADISTLHGFCQRLIKQYFFELDIEPSFTIFSEEESNFYKIKALDLLLREQQEKGEAEFLALCEMFYNNRNLSKLKENILSFYGFLQSLDNPQDYMETIATSCYHQDLDHNNACNFIKTRYANEYLYFKNTFDKLLLEADMAGEEKLSKALSGLCSNLTQKTFSSFSKMFEYFKQLNAIRSPFGSVRDKTELLEKTKETWKAFGKFLTNFFDICGEKENLDIVAQNIVDTLPAVKEFVSLCQKFEKEYTQIKSQKKALDFDDLERYAIQLLTNEKLREEIKNKYDILYIDEYQDINNKQEQILSFVTSGKNMVMVGDLKQSIYGFRNSSPQILINKTALYKKNIGGKLITLKENFRSNPTILEFVNLIFDKVMKENFGGIDYKIDGRFIGSAKYEKVEDYKEVAIDFIKVKDREESVELESKLYSVKDDEGQEDSKSVALLEAIVIASKINDMKDKPYYDAKKEEFKTLGYNNFTILCRSKAYIKQLAMHLQRYGIPVSSKTSSNIYDNPDVLFLLNLLRLVNNVNDDIALSCVLSSAFFDISFDDLASIRKKYTCEYFYECVQKYRLEVNDALRDKLNRVYDFIYNLKSKKDFATIYDLLTEADRKLGILNYYTLLPDGRARYKLLSGFIESFNSQPYNNDINEYLNYVESYLKGVEVTMQSPAQDECVHIDTIHSSKGLEYEVVFVAGCGKQFSNITARQELLKDVDLGIGLNQYDIEGHTKSKTLVKQAILEKLRLQEKLEETRLLYVALTRAKNSLNIVACIDTEKLKEMGEYEIRKSNKYAHWVLSAFPRPLIENIKACEESKCFNFNDHYEVNVYTQEDLIKKQEEVEAAPNLKSDENFTSKIKEYLEKVYPHVASFAIAQKNTVTGLMEIEGGGFESINQMPKKLVLNEHNTFDDFDKAKLGTIYHKLLQAIDFEDDSIESIKKFVEEQKLKDNDNQKYYDEVDINKLQKCVSEIKSLIQGKTIFREKQFEAYLPYQDLIESSTITDKVILQGVIDLLVGDGESLDIIDYKTTRVTKTEQLVDKYFMQMKLYKLAAERAVGKKVNNVYIYSLHLDKLIKII